MAALSSGMPSTAGYFAALPPSIALMAARLMFSGVSKSGSPAPRPITSRPAALSARALSVTAMVGEGLIRPSDSARKPMVSPIAEAERPLRDSRCRTIHTAWRNAREGVRQGGGGDNRHDILWQQ